MAGRYCLSSSTVPVNTQVTATLDCGYTTSDTDIEEELKKGEATKRYTIENWSISVQVRCEIIYQGNVIESSSHTFSTNSTVYEIKIKAGNGIDDPDLYTAKEENKTYKAVVNPSGISGSYEWTKEPANTDIINISSGRDTCTVQGLKVGSATVMVKFTPQGGISCFSGSGVEVFRPDIDTGLREDTEEETGAYIPGGKTKEITLKIEGNLPEDVEVTLSCDNPSKLSLREGNTQKSFPYSCQVSSLPKNLTLKGEGPSATQKDITLSFILLSIKREVKIR